MSDRDLVRELKNKGPQPNAIISSMATLQDVFPSSLSFDLGMEGEGRPFAVVGRRKPDLKVGDPGVIVISNQGVLHYLTPKNETGSAWKEERFRIPELEGGIIRKIAATAMDPLAGEESIVVAVSAISAQREAVFMMLRRSASDGWQKLEMPPSPFSPKDFVQNVVGTGFAGLAGGKLPTFYLCFNRFFRQSISLAGIAVDQHGKAATLAFMDNPKGIDRLVAISQDFKPYLVRLEERRLCLFPLKGELPYYWNDSIDFRFDFHDHGRGFDLPIRVDAEDATAMTPIVDGLGQCHGMFIKTKNHRLIGCRFADDKSQDAIGVLTGLQGGPASVQDLAYAYDESGWLHVFVSDENSLIWHACWAPGAQIEDMLWEPTAQRGRKLEAPCLLGKRPFVFVEGVEGSIDQITRGIHEGDVWSRAGIVVPETEPEAVPAIVHNVNLSAVTVLSRPVAGVELTVRADRPVAVEYQGKLHRLSPEHSLALKTGPTGGASFRMVANGIDPAQIIVQSKELPKLPALTIRPQDGILSRLAGLDKNFKYDGDTLVEKGLLPESLKGKKEANQVAEVLRKSALQSLRHELDSPARTYLRQRMSRMAAAEPLDMEPVRITRKPVGFTVEQVDRATNAWSLPTILCNTFSSFISTIKSGWEKIEGFIIQVVKDGVKLVSEIAGKAYEFLCKAADAIGKGIQAVLGWLAGLGSEMIDIGRRLVNWAVETLGWDDVLRCKESVKQAVLSVLDDLENVVGHAIPDLVHTGLVFAQKEVDTLFDTAVSKIHELRVDSGEVKKAKNDFQNYHHEHSAKMLAIHNAIPDVPMAAPNDLLSPQFHERLHALAEQARAFGVNKDLQRFLGELLNLFKDKADVSDCLPVIESLLQLVKPLVKMALGAVDVAQTLVFELIGEVIGFLRKLLSTPITDLHPDLAWVNNLYRQISGADLSVIDLGMLLFVTPGVLLYHLINQKPVYNKEETMPARMSSGLALVPFLLDQKPDPAKLEKTKQEVKLAYGWNMRIYDIVTSVWTLTRSYICVVENSMRVSNLAGVSTTGAGTLFSALVGLCDYGPLLYYLSCLNYLEYGEYVKSHPMMYAVLGIAFQAFLCLAVYVEIMLLSGGEVGVWLASFLSLMTGAAMYLVHVFLIVYYFVLSTSQKTAKEIISFSLARIGGMALQIRKLTQFGVPVGYEIATKSAGQDYGVGAAILVLSAATDSLLYLAGGAVLFTRASMPALTP